MSNCLWPHGLQYTRLHCLPLYPRVFSSSYLLSQWFYLTISSSPALFSVCLQYLPASETFAISWLLASSGQSIGVSCSASDLPMNIQNWFHLGLAVGSPCSPRNSQKSSPIPQFKSIDSFVFILLYGPTSIHNHWKKSQLWLSQPLLVKVMSLPFNVCPGLS